MQLAIVQGRATATIKHPALTGMKLLVCQMIDAQGLASDDPVLVVDGLGAGAGDKVILSTDGYGMESVPWRAQGPARWLTLGIVD